MAQARLANAVYARYRGSVNDGLPKLPVPPPARFRWSLDVLRWYFAPEYLHLERADRRRPTLFVGNHSLYGVLDVLLFADGLYREPGISPPEYVGRDPRCWNALLEDYRVRGISPSVRSETL